MLRETVGGCLLAIAFSIIAVVLCLETVVMCGVALGLAIAIAGIVGCALMFDIAA